MNPEIAIENALVSAIDSFEGTIEIGWGTQNMNATFGPQPEDPIIMANAIESLGRQVEDMEVPLEFSKEAVVDDVESHFKTESGPDGTPWAEWADSYSPVAERQNIGKLRRRETLELFDAATDRNNYHVVSNDLFIDTGSFPIYWAIQQYGGLIKTERNLIRRSGRRRAGTNYGKVPSRPYLGMSPQAQTTVGAVFDAWLGGLIIGFNPVSFGKGIIPIFRTPRGPRFGKVSSL